MKSFFLVLLMLPTVSFASLSSHPYSDMPREPSGYLGDCPAPHFEDLVGQSGKFVQWLSEDESRIRIIVPGRSYTMEYVPDRLNVHLDNDGVIEQVSCG